MEDNIRTNYIGYALGIAIVGVMAYLGIKGTNEAIDYQNSRLSNMTNGEKMTQLTDEHFELHTKNKAEQFERQKNKVLRR